MKSVKEILGIQVEDIIGEDHKPLEYRCECGEIVKEQRMKMLGGPRKGEWFRAKIGCKCEDVELGRQALEESKMAKVRKLQDQFEQGSLLNESLKKASFMTFSVNTQNQAKAFRAAKHYANEFDINRPKNLILYGPPQVGKSHLAKSITDDVVAKGHTALFINVPKLLTKVRSTYKPGAELSEEQILNLLKEVDLLVIDDIGAEKSEDKKQKDWSDTLLWQIIDDRQGKHTVYTSNLNDYGLGAFYNQRTVARMMNNTEKQVVGR